MSAAAGKPAGAADAAGRAPPPEFGIETLAVHAGARPDPATGARATPIYQTTSFVFDDAAHAAELFNLQTFGYIYSRIGNPTVAAFEERIAALEDGRGAVAAASGHAAQFLAAAALLEPGDAFVASRNLYGGSITQFGQSFPKLGWTCRFVDMTDPANVRAAMDGKVRFVFCESLANPGGVVIDLEAVAAIAREFGVPVVVDNTLATPWLMRPFDWGADVVIHSATKFIGGHGSTMGGVVVESGRFDWRGSDKFPGLSRPDPAYHGLTFAETFGDFALTMKLRAVALRDYGPCMDPQAAWNLLQGVETLPLRMERHCANAQAVAEWLDADPRVSWVSYAGLPSSPYRALARKYLPRGAGAVFTFGLVGGYEAGVAAVDRVELFSHLANIGDTRSLIIHPASTTHRQLSAERQVQAGAGPDVVRLSVGIESVDDLIRDLDRALSGPAR